MTESEEAKINVIVVDYIKQPSVERNWTHILLLE